MKKRKNIRIETKQSLIVDMNKRKKMTIKLSSKNYENIFDSPDNISGDKESGDASAVIRKINETSFTKYLFQSYLNVILGLLRLLRRY